MGSPTLTQKTATSRAREEVAFSINTTAAINEGLLRKKWYGRSSQDVVDW